MKNLVSDLQVYEISGDIFEIIFMNNISPSFITITIDVIRIRTFSVIEPISAVLMSDKENLTFLEVLDLQNLDIK